MYNGLFDEHHQLLIMPFRNGPVEKHEIKISSKGEWQGDLLCSTCENEVLNKPYENYANRIIYGGKLKNRENPEFQKCINPQGIEFLKCRGINYHKFKLFLLSFLWRASVSTRPFFSEIKLPPKHEDEIRKMLLSKDAGDVYKYPSSILTYANSPFIPRDIAQPRLISESEDLMVYSFMINGYFYEFFINESSAILPHYVIPETLNPANEMNINVIPEGMNVRLYTAQFGVRL